ILGILMLTAIPAVTRAIARSRKNTFWQNAKQYIQAVQTPYLSGEYVLSSSTTSVCPLPEPGKSYYILLDDIDLDAGSKDKSSFGAQYKKSGTCQPRVIVANIGTGQVNGENKDKIVWYFVGLDQSNNGITNPVSESALSFNSVEVGNGGGSNNHTCGNSVTGGGTPVRCQPQ
ncbi:MAG: hypothetical protein ILA19_05395, partial [Bacilli bacterium]|nr:hypothetical protein [Bacilli bacterium]